MMYHLKICFLVSSDYDELLREEYGDYKVLVKWTEEHKRFYFDTGRSY